MDALKNCATLMGKATCIKAAAELRDLTIEEYGKELRAKGHNATRWSSYLDMTNRYVKIKKQLEDCDRLEKWHLAIQKGKQATGKDLLRSLYHVQRCCERPPRSHSDYAMCQVNL